MPTESQLRDSALRARIRQRIDTGRFPVFVPGTVYVGYGAGLNCYACDEPITRGQVEYHLHDPTYGPPMSLHLGCHVLWQIECIERLRQRR